MDNSVRVWDPHSGRELANFRDLSAPAVHMALSPDGTALAASTMKHEVHVWDIPTRRHRFTVPGFANLAFSNDGHSLAIGGRQIVRLWNAETGEEQPSLPVRTPWVRAVAYSHDGRYLAAVGDDASVEIWDMTSRTLQQTLAAPTEDVASVAFSPDGRLLATGGHDQIIRLWNLASGSVERVLEGHEGRISVLTFSPDGTRLASGSHDKTVRLWSLPK